MLVLLRTPCVLPWHVLETSTVTWLMLQDQQWLYCRLPPAFVVLFSFVPRPISQAELSSLRWININFRSAPYVTGQSLNSRELWSLPVSPLTWTEDRNAASGVSVQIAGWPCCLIPLHSVALDHVLNTWQILTIERSRAFSRLPDFCVFMFKSTGTCMKGHKKHKCGGQGSLEVT